MKGDKQVIAHLNTILKNELTAINQYFLHARMYKNWGLNKLNKHEYIFHAGTLKKNNKVYAIGGRVLNLVALSDEFIIARQIIHKK